MERAFQQKPTAERMTSRAKDKAIEEKEDWLNEHGDPDFAYLQSLATDGSPEALEKLTNIAEDLNVEHDLCRCDAWAFRQRIDRKHRGRRDVYGKHRLFSAPHPQRRARDAQSFSRSVSDLSSAY